MTKIYLFCSAGMSTSMLAAAMVKAASDHNLDVEIKAFSEKIAGQVVADHNPDIMLLGPQVKFLYEDYKERFGKDRPVAMISQMDYALANGEAVLKAAVIELKKFRQEKGENK